MSGLFDLKRQWDLLMDMWHQFTDGSEDNENKEENK